MRVVHSRQSLALSRASPAAPRFRVVPVTLSLGIGARDADPRPGGRKAKEAKGCAQLGTGHEGGAGREVAGVESNV